jgi:hypothetical protein
MRADDILTLVHAVPFRAFRIHLNGGKSYDIRHPEMVRVGRSTLHIFFADRPESPYERFEIVSLLLVERIEPIEAVAIEGHQ